MNKPRLEVEYDLVTLVVPQIGQPSEPVFCVLCETQVTEHHEAKDLDTGKTVAVCKLCAKVHRGDLKVPRKRRR